MTGKNTLSRILLIFSLSLGAFAVAQAQIPPGGDKPATGDAKPGDAPKPKPKFKSPWNGERDPEGQEATEFGKLLDLYDTLKDAEAALEAAKRCHQNEAEWQKVVDAAKEAFATALATYINGWSSITYSGMKFSPGTGDVTPRSRETMEKMAGYEGDRKKVLDALNRDDKKAHPVPDKCPLPPAPPPSGADIAPEHSSLPPCDDGDKVASRIEGREVELAEIMEDERTADDAALARLKTQEASLREELAGLTGLKACPSDYRPPPEESGGGPSITIGIGVGVGGGDRHHDRHREDHPREDHPPAEHRD